MQLYPVLSVLCILPQNSVCEQLDELLLGSLVLAKARLQRQNQLWSVWQQCGCCAG
jgi:hypothetical protein